MSHYTIGQLSKAVGLPPKTIRFYEEESLITPARRNPNGYREFSDIAKNELLLIKYARDLGLPLSEIKTLIYGCNDGNCSHPQSYINTSISNYLVLLETKMTQLTNLKSRLLQLQANLAHSDQKCNGQPYSCNLLHQLIALPKGGE